MAMTSEHKLYAAVGVLVLLGGVYYLQSKEQKADAASHSYGELNKNLPKLAISDDDIKKIDKVVLTKPKSDDAKKKDEALEHVLVKAGEEWNVEKPVKALANKANVESLLKNLKSLEIKELLSKKAEDFGTYDVTDEKALHAVFYKGKEVAYEFWFGRKGGIGQITRIKGHEGAYAVDGYSGYLYEKDTKGWRDLKIFEFDEKKAKSIDLSNENGIFAFSKDGEEWKSKHQKSKTQPATAIKEFEAKKVDDLLRAFKGLNANGFGDGKSLADVGLEEPLATLTITLDDGAKRELFVGSTGEGSSRWVKTAGKEIYSISSWAGDWTTAAPEKFQKKKDEDKGDDEGEGDEDDDVMPMEMPGGPHGAPPGHP
jgi:hypothetical protein